MSSLLTLAKAMTPGRFQRLSNPSESTLANAPFTLAEFDFNPGTTWPNIGSVPGSSQGSGATFSWSSAVCDRRDGYVMQNGGGHTDSLRGELYGFNTDLAAAAFLSGGSPVRLWDLLVRGPRYLAFSAGRPSSAVSPTGAIQIAPASTDWYSYKNLDGIAVPVTVHPWFCKTMVPSTGKVILAGASGWGNPDVANSNSGFFYDRDTGLMGGPLIFAGGAPAHLSTSYGHAGNNAGQVSPIYFSDLDGCAYSIGNTDNFAWILQKITSPLTSSIALTATVFDPSLSPNTAAAWQGLPDPANPGVRMIFQHAAPSSSQLDTEFLVIYDPEGRTTGPTFNWMNYASINGVGTILPATGGPTFCCYAYDSKRKIIWMWDGTGLYKITPDAGGNLANWSLQKTAFTGTAGVSAPSVPTGGGTLPSIEYVPGADVLIMTMLDEVWTFKPSDWSDPSMPTPYQGVLLGLWGWQGTQITARAASPVEALATVVTTVTGDSGVPIETIGTISGDIAPMTEDLMVISAADAAPRLEALASARADSGTPIEFIATIRLDATAPIEWSATIRIDGQAPVEAFAGARNDAGVPSEVLGSVSADRAAPVETLGSVARDASVPAESLGTIRNDVVLPDETPASARADRGAPDEFLAGIRSDPAAPAEWTGAISVTMDSSAALEWVATVRADRGAATETLTAVRADSGGDAEWLAGCLRDALAPIEFIARLSADVAGKVEFQTVVAGDAAGRLEWQGTIARDAAAPGAFSATLVADGAGRVEWTGLVNGVTGDSGLRIEWSATIRRDGAAPITIGGVACPKPNPRAPTIAATPRAAGQVAEEREC